MKFRGHISHSVLASLLAFAFGGAAKAHAPVAILPLHHAGSLAVVAAHKTFPTFFTLHSTSSTALIHKQLTSLVGLSGATKAQLKFDSQLVAAGVKTGTSSFPGGIITGGNLNGTGYLNGVIGGSPVFSSFGQGYVTIGSTPNTGSNFLTFQANTIKAIPTAPFSIDGHHLSGAVHAALTRNNEYLFGGVRAGQNSFNGKIIGGELNGTIYAKFGSSYEGYDNALIAFGKDPLNPSLPILTPVTALTSTGYIKFANGITEQVSNGSLLFTSGTSSLFSFFPGGASYLAIAGNPLNTHAPTVVANILANYIFFKK